MQVIVGRYSEDFCSYFSLKLGKMAILSEFSETTWGIW